MKATVERKIELLYKRAISNVEKIKLNPEKFEEHKDRLYKQAFDMQMLCYRYVRIYHKGDNGVIASHLYRLAQIAFLTDRYDVLKHIYNAVFYKKYACGKTKQKISALFNNACRRYEIKDADNPFRFEHTVKVAKIEYPKKASLLVCDCETKQQKIIDVATTKVGIREFTDTKSLETRNILGFEQSGKTITKVNFEYPFERHSFGIGDVIVWYFKAVHSQHKVSAFEFRGNRLFVITDTGEDFSVSDCFNASILVFLNEQPLNH